MFLMAKAISVLNKAAGLLEKNRVRLSILPRRNQKEQVSRKTRHSFNAAHQIIETTNSQMTQQFNVNRLLDNPDFLQIKQNNNI